MRTIAAYAASGLIVSLAAALSACGGSESVSSPAAATLAPSTAAAISPSRPTATPARASATAAPTPVSAATPTCTSGAAATPSQTEGPYFKAGSPERASLLESGTAGTKLVVAGYVLTRDCKPVAGAVLDFWQADDRGNYDNTGYTLRGHQTSASDGSYRLETIVPGLYTGRTEHIHVKVQAPGKTPLTTQLYFPGVTENDSDGIFDRRLLMDVRDAAGGKAATFDFILDL